ncbi:O97 family O-antigen export ABC transporter permease subunit [Escherichia coli]|uniref:Transport permease protein n=2 Tax=Escherichia coli TaxID=562 RepID=A0A0A8J5Z9_ECOLX|nr:O97 family O-antigen export ABC transporter permease subunit [Escherichia coli]AIG62858.1 O-antigen ABC transporter permease [Escherichia coli]EFL6449385.1 ABC transporter permease [Escherichia coli]MCH0687078.1 O97 family O-antigen export ABC transporter permease subunit [Escherichia coli]MDZ8665138.1 O97 family O-antigen export ABC transporter permease subunit [Escherichia coli]WRX85991.1 O97 family O-antigen export ABC transporter permease subunit [Escherichia coli]
MLYSSLRLAIFEIQKRSLNTYAGWTWSLMNPLSQMAILYFIMTHVFKSNIENILLWLISGLNCWIVIQSALLRSCQSLISRRALLQNNNISHNLLVMSDILSEVIILIPFYLFAIALAIFHGVPFSNLILVPLMLLILLVFLLGLGMILATLTPILRDLPYLLGIFMQIAFWLTPIAYAKSSMKGFAASIINFNPFTYFILLSQSIFMGSPVSMKLVVIPAGLAIIAVSVGFMLSNAVGKKTVINL